MTLSLNWPQAVPFFVGALTQVLGVAVQRLGDHMLRQDFQVAMSDVSENQYVVPPNFDLEGLSRRWMRDMDAVASVGFGTTTFGLGIALLDKGNPFFTLALAFGALVPLTTFALLITTNPQRYYAGTKFGVSPFVRWSVSISFVIGAIALVR